LFITIGSPKIPPIIFSVTGTANVFVANPPLIDILIESPGCGELGKVNVYACVVESNIYRLLA